MAAQLAAGPAGTVTASFPDSAQREGAFRWLASRDVSVDGVTEAMGVAAFAESRGRVYCAVDGTSMTLTDRARTRELGAVGTWRAGARGLVSLTSLLMDEAGTPLGVPGVRFWARTQRSRKRIKPHKSLQTETLHTIELLGDIETRRAAHAPNVRVHYLLDRGFDAWAVFRLARDSSLEFTVRSRNDRSLLAIKGKRQRSLRATVARARSLGQTLLEVPARWDRAARLCALDVRAVRVPIMLRVGKKRREGTTLTALLAREIGYRGPNPMHWLLLTSERVESLDDAQRSLDGYAMRWRIEELHRTWKAGWCNVERTQLRRRDAICKWATLHLAVAARAIHLARRARSEPNVPSSEEFSRDEIDAVLLWQSRRTRHRPGDTPPLGELVMLIAMLGGYTGRSSGGPPGPTVIGRGLGKIAIAAETLQLNRKK